MKIVGEEFWGVSWRRNGEEIALDVMNYLEQTFLYQELTAVIDGQLWKFVVTPLGKC